MLSAPAAARFASATRFASSSRFAGFGFAALGTLFVHDTRGDFFFATFVTPFLAEFTLEFAVFAFAFLV